MCRSDAKLCQVSERFSAFPAAVIYSGKFSAALVGTGFKIGCDYLRMGATNEECIDIS